MWGSHRDPTRLAPEGKQASADQVEAVAPSVARSVARTVARSVARTVARSEARTPWQHIYGSFREI